MGYDYDALYGSTPDALGAPTAIFVDFFRDLGRQGCRVLDVGCGQGRDALFIARAGHQVVGVDLSENGIRDLRAAATRENLPITGVVADITQFVPEGLFDIILIDRTLHMLPVHDQRAVLKTMLDHVAGQGWVLIADEVSNIADFKTVVAAHHSDWQTHHAKRGDLFIRRV